MQFGMTTMKNEKEKGKLQETQPNHNLSQQHSSPLSQNKIQSFLGYKEDDGNMNINGIALNKINNILNNFDNDFN